MKYLGLPYCRTGWNLHMMPIGYLMIEHRLIERMIKLITEESAGIDKTHKARLPFLDKAIDFIRSYADKCHHGKEEDILFKWLSARKLLLEHRKTMERLIEEHKMGRKAVAKLVAAKDSYAAGEKGALASVKRQLTWLTGFYSRHIAKEDKSFFIPSMGYFDKNEQERMLRVFFRFDGFEIQTKYRKLVESLEKHKK